MRYTLILFFNFIFFNITYSQLSSNNNKIYFVDSVSKYKTLEDILSLPKFINKTVYIDYWATTCAPCIKEFSNIADIKKSNILKNVEFIYICDNYHGNQDDIDRKNWKNLVLKHQLEGTHFYFYITPPNKIIHDVIDLNYLTNHQNDKLYGVPTYFIAKEGKIIIYNAKRPSEKVKLVAQIDSVIRIPKIF